MIVNDMKYRYHLKTTARELSCDYTNVCTVINFEVRQKLHAADEFRSNISLNLGSNVEQFTIVSRSAESKLYFTNDFNNTVPMTFHCLC